MPRVDPENNDVLIILMSLIVSYHIQEKWCLV